MGYGELFFIAARPMRLQKIEKSQFKHEAFDVIKKYLIFTAKREFRVCVGWEVPLAWRLWHHQSKST